ncbi:unnamed protein product, partial [Didymodactylos carnosus]
MPPVSELAISGDEQKAKRTSVLSVSDLSSQIWCEQQLCYKFLYPYVMNDEGEIKRIDDKPHIVRGTSLHLERELEIQVKIPVECVTREDSYGVRLLNMIQAFDGLIKWKNPTKRYITREMPIFGNLYGGRLYFRGIIDEINFDPVKNHLEVVEFKTRSTKAPPRPQQVFTHEVQVNIYRTLIDELIQAQTDKELYFKRFNLDMTMILSESIYIEYIKSGYLNITTLEHAFDFLIQLVQQMPTITTHGSIEYILQSDPTYKQRKEFERNEMKLKQLLDKLEPYWLGEREPKGVDIEDAYKCQMCDY